MRPVWFKLRRMPVELIFWISALVFLAAAGVHPHGAAPHFTLCPLANMGISWCPGCGTGRAITDLLHGNFAESFKHHWFGLPALLIISRRIVELTRLNFINNKPLNLKYREEKYV